MKILFIDDDVARNTLLIGFFEQVEGWKILWAKTPSDALLVLKDELPTLEAILLDVMMAPDNVIDRNKSEMGRSTGILLLEEINRITQGSVPVLLLTARKDLQWLVNENKVVAYMQKPMLPEEICKHMKKILEKPSTEFS
jgi:DNA-binding response OmpR family regulator